MLTLVIPRRWNSSGDVSGGGGESRTLCGVSEFGAACAARSLHEAQTIQVVVFAILV